MARVLLAELRTSRSRWWSLLLAGVYLLVALLLSERDGWKVWLNEASISAVAGIVFTGILIPIIAAIEQQIWRKSTLSELGGVTPGKKLLATAVRLGVNMFYLALVPLVISTVVIRIMAGIAGAENGIFTPVYAALCVVFACALICIGSAIGDMLPSRIAAIVAAAVVGFVLSTYLSPAPAANDPWTKVSLAGYGATIGTLLGGIVLLLLGALIRGESRGNVRVTTAQLARGSGVSILAIACVALFFNGPVRVNGALRDPQPGVCAEKGGARACVWPGDEVRLPFLLNVAQKLARIYEALGEPRETLTVVEKQIIGGDYTVSPMTGGDGGLWLAADSVAFEMLADRMGQAQTVCPTVEKSQEELSAEWDMNWKLNEVFTQYLFGGERPPEVEVEDAAIDASLGEIRAKTRSWSEAQQADWIVSNIKAIDNCERLKDAD
ncbi:Uncharacterised protein [Actinobaculum suis]|uniref:Uncharacterized protein n=1 Tax=Actinobaculum suis TaxID=1657 RepID=A0A7Z9C7P8_9ACTO|nr:Uncharacterised protein [Actinobaculum suis]